MTSWNHTVGRILDRFGIPHTLVREWTGTGPLSFRRLDDRRGARRLSAAAPPRSRRRRRRSPRPGGRRPRGRSAPARTRTPRRGPSSLHLLPEGWSSRPRPRRPRPAAGGSPLLEAGVHVGLLRGPRRSRRYGWRPRRSCRAPTSRSRVAVVPRRDQACSTTKWAAHPRRLPSTPSFSEGARSSPARPAGPRGAARAGAGGAGDGWAPGASRRRQRRASWTCAAERTSTWWLLRREPLEVGHVLAAGQVPDEDLADVPVVLEGEEPCCGP